MVIGFLRYDKRMAAGQRIDVQKCQGEFVLINLLGWDFTAYDLAEYGILHTSSIQPWVKIYGMTKILNTLNDGTLTGLLKSGAVGVLPTDTVYGLVACASLPEAASRVLEVKGRPYKPGTLIAADADQLIDLGIKARYIKAVEQFWPGAISVVVPMGPELDYLHSGAYSLPIRIPDHLELLKLLQNTGPLITTSANLPDQPTAVTVAEVQEIFGAKLDFYVDGGDLSNRPPSTIIRMVDDAIEVLRDGAVKIDEETGRIL